MPNPERRRIAVGQAYTGWLERGWLFALVQFKRFERYFFSATLAYVGLQRQRFHEVECCPPFLLEHPMADPMEDWANVEIDGLENAQGALAVARLV